MKGKRIGIVLGMLALILGGLSLTACNTVEGAGEDLQWIGEGMENVGQSRVETQSTSPYEP